MWITRILNSSRTPIPNRSITSSISSSPPFRSTPDVVPSRLSCLGRRLLSTPAVAGSHPNHFSAPNRSFRSFRSFSSSSSSSSSSSLPSRDSMSYDVLIVGGGPSGLSAAIRLKQLSPDLSICLVEKGAEIGSHILSGNVFEPKAMDELLPNWKELIQDSPTPVSITPVKKDSIFFLTKTRSIPLPVPPPLHNHGNFILSLSQLTRFLASQAEAAGVEIYPGFAADEILYAPASNSSGQPGDPVVIGVATKDAGIGKDGRHKATFTRGMELRAKQTLFAEGARGSCSEEILSRYRLREARNADPQTYGLGVKEVWEVSAEDFEEGKVVHTIGWPADPRTWFGTFMYHWKDRKVLLGAVTGLDYENAYVSPYHTFQQFKHHPLFSPILSRGKCIAYGARVINEGGLQSIPKLTFPGGMLIGCSAGFLNVPKIKGTHLAMKSGMIAAETIVNEWEKNTKEGEGDGAALEEGKELVAYESAVRSSWIWSELHSVRNVHPSFKFFGLYPFSLYSAFELFLAKGRVPWTFRNCTPDAAKTKPLAECKKIEYPKADGKVSFELLTNLARSGVKHDEDQPSHLKVREGMEKVPIDVSWKVYGAPETRFCPAKVYEVLTDEDGKSNPRLQINKSNCVHCKSCAIKTPQNYIKWTVPEGGGGPNYTEM